MKRLVRVHPRGVPVRVQRYSCDLVSVVVDPLDTAVEGLLGELLVTVPRGRPLDGQPVGPGLAQGLTFGKLKETTGDVVGLRVEVLGQGIDTPPPIEVVRKVDPLFGVVLPRFLDLIEEGSGD